jgi:hypothetical protein
MVLTPNDLFPGTINIVNTQLYCRIYITVNLILYSLAVHANTHSVHAGILEP